MQKTCIKDRNNNITDDHWIRQEEEAWVDFLVQL